MPLNRHINSFAILRQLILRVRTMARSLDTSPQLPAPQNIPLRHTFCCSAFPPTGDTQLHRHRGFITGD